LGKALRDGIRYGFAETRTVSPEQRQGSQEAAVFAAVLQGQFLLKGFTNRDVRE
jgi:hypothetical protein